MKFLWNLEVSPIYNLEAQRRGHLLSDIKNKKKAVEIFSFHGLISALLLYSIRSADRDKAKKIINKIIIK